MAFVTWPGSNGNYIRTPDTNELDADTAHIFQSIGVWTNQSADFTGAATLVSDTDPLALGGKALEITLIASPNQPRMATGPSGNNFPATAGQVYTGSVPVKMGQAGNTGFLSLDFYDGANSFLGRTESVGVALPAGSYQELTVTATAPASTAWVSLRQRLTPAVGGDVLRIGRAMIRKGSDAAYIRSIRVLKDLDMQVLGTVRAAATSNRQLIFNWVSPSGVNFTHDRGNGYLWSRFGNGTTGRLGSGTNGSVTADVEELWRAYWVASSGSWTYTVNGAPAGSGSGVTGDGAHPNPADITVGAQTNGTEAFFGDMRYARMYDGRADQGGLLVAEMNAANIPGSDGPITPGTSWQDQTGRTWTVTGSGLVLTVEAAAGVKARQFGPHRRRFLGGRMVGPRV